MSFRIYEDHRSNLTASSHGKLGRPLLSSLNQVWFQRREAEFREKHARLPKTTYVLQNVMSAPYDYNMSIYYLSYAYMCTLI